MGVRDKNIFLIQYIGLAFIVLGLWVLLESIFYFYPPFGFQFTLTSFYTYFGLVQQLFYLLCLLFLVLGGIRLLQFKEWGRKVIVILLFILLLAFSYWSSPKVPVNWVSGV